MRIPKSLPTKFVVPIFLASVIGTVAAAQMLLFTHTFPSVATSPQPPDIITSCSTLVDESGSPVQGTRGNLTFDCGTGVAAFNSTASSSGKSADIPTFDLTGTGYTSLYLWTLSIGGQANTNPPCTGSFLAQIQSGNGYVLGYVGVTTQYDYCAVYSNAPTNGFGTFNVQWTQIT